jgi:hypothetical protein
MDYTFVVGFLVRYTRWPLYGPWSLPCPPFLSLNPPLCLANFSYLPRGFIFHHTLSLLMPTVCVTPFLALGNARLSAL